MMDRGRVRAWGFAAAGLAAAGMGGVGYTVLRRNPPTGAPAASTIAKGSATTEKSSLPELSAAIGKGDGLALAVLKSRLETKAEGPAPALTEAEASQWIDALAGVRAGLSRFSAYGRASSVVVISEILRKFDAAPAPSNWTGVLRPASEVLSAALADRVWEVRVAALSEVKNLWRWSPGRDMITVENDQLAGWKVAL